MSIKRGCIAADGHLVIIVENQEQRENLSRIMKGNGFMSFHTKFVDVDQLQSNFRLLLNENDIQADSVEDSLRVYKSIYIDLSIALIRALYDENIFHHLQSISGLADVNRILELFCSNSVLASFPQEIWMPKFKSGSFEWSDSINDVVATVLHKLIYNELVMNESAHETLTLNESSRDYFRFLFNASIDRVFQSRQTSLLCFKGMFDFQIIHLSFAYIYDA